MPLTIGDPAPDFSLTDPVTGRTVSLADLRGGDALVVFLRGTWCPYCREQLRVLAERHPTLERAGVRLVTIACQRPEAIRRHVGANPLPFPLLADTDRRAAKAFGVHYWLRWEGFDLAHPSLFILDRDARIAFAHVGRSMRDLPVALLLDKFLGFLEPAG